MKKQLALLACTLLSRMLFSQAVPMALEEWRTNSGTQDFYFKNLTKTDPSGNVIVAGTAMNGGTTDILVAKYTSGGVQLWIQQFAGTAPNGVDFAAGLFVDNNYVYLTGAITNNTVVPETDCVTMKLASSTGSVVWSSTYDGAGNFHDMGKHVTVDGSGNVFVSGASYNASMNTDILCLRYNSSGVQQWASTWDYLGFDDASIKVATSGANLNITGAVTTATAGAYKLATLSLSQSTGSLLATNVSTAVTTTSVDVVTDFTSDGSGNIIIVGSNTVGGQGNNFYVQKMSNTLVTAWTYTWNGSSSLDDVAKAIELDASGNVYIAGYSTSSTLGKELTLIKLNSGGTQQWVQTSGFNGNDEASDLILDASGDVYVGGYKTDSTQNYYTAKYDGSGTKIWETEMNGNYGLNDYVTNITLDSLDNVIVTGQSEITAGTYNFTTVKYAQHDVITPTDFNGETPSNNFMYFRNSGQVVDTSFTSVSAVRFYTHNTWPSFYFRNHSQNFVFSRIDTLLATTDTLHRIDLDFTNAIESSETYALDEQEDGYLNYYMGYLPEQITNVHGNQRLVTPNLYSNIDLMCSSNQNGIKYYFIVKPGGDMRDIKMEFTGATSYSLDGTTNELSINSSIGSFSFDRPTAYQLTAGNATVAVTGWTPDWTTDGAANKYKFNDGAYTSSLTLVIEVDQGNTAAPTATTTPNIEWSTNFGSSGFDTGVGLKNDASNNLYLIGSNSTAPLPQAFGINASQLYQSGNKGLLDGYVAKFDQTGKLLWRTYIGGSGNDGLNGFDVAGNGTGDIYCVGITQSATMQVVPKAGTTVNHVTHASAGTNKDGFIFQLNQAGTICNWLTYYGGTGEDALSGCKFDQLGNLFIIGMTESNTFDIVGTAPQYTCAYNDPNGTMDAYVMKLNNSTFNIDWATYVNSPTSGADCSSDGFNTLDFSANNDVFIGGSSSGIDYPILYSAGSSTQAPVPNCLGDGIITRFSNTGEMLWSTYLASTGTDAVQAIKINDRDIYVGGSTTGITTFPTKFSGLLYANTTKSVTPSGPYPQSGFLVWFDDLNKRQHATLIGGDYGNDQITGIAIDAVNNIYLVGPTTSTSLDQPSGGNPVNTWSENNKGLYDEFIFTIKNGTTDVIWSTEIGGDNQEGVGAVSIAIDGNNKLFLSCKMQSTVNFPWNDGGGYPVHFQGSLTGGQNDHDACITRFKLSDVNYVGIKEYDPTEGNIFLYPNPTQGSLTIRLTNVDQKKNFTIFNTMGQAVTSGSLVSGLTTINVANLADGMYFMEIRDKTTKVTAKFIKQ